VVAGGLLPLGEWRGLADIARDTTLQHALIDEAESVANGAGARLMDDLREMVTEQIVYRELLLRMTHRDLLLRYKQTIMGLGWAIFMPLINTVVFSVIFMRVAPIETGVPYPLFAYSGLLVWNAFASALRFSVTSLTANSNLVTKIYFPREIFPISAVLVTLVDAAVGGLVLVAMMVYYHVGVTLAILLLPIVILVLVAFTCAVALTLAMANLFYRDVKYLFELVITVWMFATSVVYPIEMVQGRLGMLLKLNPMVPIVDAFRAVVIRGAVPDLASFLGVAVMSFIALCGAWLLFHRAEFQFAENI
jgi:ABC-type polysaccharide/polyol phosphate export permease